ncbi:hypothetical protein SAMN05444166_4146 [Singulisphaera sp. GP187]|nr:hypothetical protein SAMN05444166_4146 [Singulisphaera sp. GP187]
MDDVWAADHRQIVLRSIKLSPLRADQVERAELWRGSSLPGAGSTSSQGALQRPLLMGWRESDPYESSADWCDRFERSGDEHDALGFRQVDIPPGIRRDRVGFHHGAGAQAGGKEAVAQVVGDLIPQDRVPLGGS